MKNCETNQSRTLIITTFAKKTYLHEAFTVVVSFSTFLQFSHRSKCISCFHQYLLVQFQQTKRYLVQDLYVCESIKNIPANVREVEPQPLRDMLSKRGLNKKHASKMAKKLLEKK